MKIQSDSLNSVDVDHVKELRRLKLMNSFVDVWKSPYFQEHFIMRYAFNLELAVVELFGGGLTMQQIEVVEEFYSCGGFEGARVAFPSGHGIGKTYLIGIFSSLHLLCFYSSITRIQAPKLEQVKKYSFKEINGALDQLSNHPKWGFLVKFIQRNKTLIYIKGEDTNWYIEASTAPKGDPTNLSGQHQFSYLLIFDEASGIEDKHIEASLGGLTEQYNSCIAFSQHTINRGHFHKWVTTSSKNKGGVWGGFRLSSRLSPRVLTPQLLSMIGTYNEDEQRVRLDGLNPIQEKEMLISHEDIEKAYDGKIQNKQYDQLIISYDVGFSGWRDKSYATFTEVAVEEDIHTSKVSVYQVVKHIYRLNAKGVMPVDFTTNYLLREIFDYLEKNKDKEYLTIYLVGDANVGGQEAYTRLEEILEYVDTYQFICKGIKWGSDKLYFSDKQRFFNARAKGFVLLSEGMIHDRVKVATDEYRGECTRQLSQLPFMWTSKSLYKMVAKDQMAKMNIPSPDLADCLAQNNLADLQVTSYTDIEVKKSEIEQELTKNLKNKTESVSISDFFKQK